MSTKKKPTSKAFVERSMNAVHKSPEIKTRTPRHRKMDENTYAIFVGNYQHLTEEGKAEARAEAARRGDDALTRLYGIPQESPRAAEEASKRAAEAERITRALDALLRKADEETRDSAVAHIRIAMGRYAYVLETPSYGDFCITRDVDRLQAVTQNLRRFIPDAEIAEAARDYINANAGRKAAQ